MELVLPAPPQATAFWRRQDVRCQLVAGVVIALTPFFLRSIPSAALALLLASVLLASASPAWPLLASRLGGVVLFLLMVVIFLPWTMGEPYWTWGSLRLSIPGLRLGLLIILRALTMVVVIAWLLASQPVETLLKAGQDLGLPRFLATLLLLTHRYVHLFFEELHLLRITLRTRGYRNRPSLHSYRTIGHVTGALLVRSYERAERVDQAMCCRGFAGEFRSLHRWHLCWQDPLLAIALILLNAVLPLTLDLWLRS